MPGVTATTATAPPLLAGWGYEGRSVDDLVDDARRQGATVVVDVRLNAISRRRGFSKRALADGLAAAGIRYVHLRALGNPRENRPGFALTGTAAGRAARDRYRSEVLASEAGRTALAALNEEDAALVLCFEADERCCHRSQVLDAVRDLRASEERRLRA